MAEQLIVNMSNDREVDHLIASLRKLVGRWRISFTRHAARRSDRQLRYYFPCFCDPLAKFLTEQGECRSKEQVHEMFKLLFLRESICDPRTGEEIGQTIKSTGDLTTIEFNEYLDKCAAWLWERVGINVPEPSIYHEREERPLKAQVTRVPRRQLYGPSGQQLAVRSA